MNTQIVNIKSCILSDIKDNSDAVRNSVGDASTLSSNSNGLTNAQKICAALEQIEAAATLIRTGRLVAFPTETVYGLGADALNEGAVREIYKVKNRPPDNPLIIHIDSMDQLGALAADVSEHAKILARRFWPGPLTMVFRKRGDLPGFVTADMDTVAVRMPSHPVARALLKAAKTPVAAPSANPSGKPSPTSGAHVIHDLSGKIDMIIDSGPVTVGLESTVLDVTRVPAVILRSGGVTYSMIADAIGSENVTRYPGADNHNNVCKPKSPGVKYRHYAPDAPMLLFRGIQRPSRSGWICIWIKKVKSLPR